MKTLAKARAGIAATELAILAPFFGIMIMGMIELTRVMNVKIALDDAARKGCRSAIMPGHGTKYPTTTTTGASASQDVIDILNESGLDPTRATLTVTVGTNAATVYSVSGSGGSYTVSQSSGSGSDPLTAASGTKISVKIGMNSGDFSWTGSTRFVPSTMVQSETVTMAKQ